MAIFSQEKSITNAQDIKEKLYLKYCFVLYADFNNELNIKNHG